jgi:hypothetical protein
MAQVAYARHFRAASAVAQCVAALGVAEQRLLVVFCGGKHDPLIVLGEFRARYGDALILGGSAAGAISHNGLGYSGLELGVIAFGPADPLPRVFVSHALAEGEQRAGFELGRQVGEAAQERAVALVFFDSVATGSPLRLHHASSLVDGFQAGLGGKVVTLIGGGLLTDINLSDGWVFDGTGVCKHAAIALVFPPGVTAETVVLHGCRPVSTFMEITRIDGPVLFELDGEPALGVLERMLHLAPGSGDAELSLIATLGQKQGDPFAPYDENAYVNRLIVGADRGRGSITLFEPDFRTGAHVQIMSRDNVLMLESVRSGVAALNRSLRSGNWLFSLYIDCAGRASAKSGAVEEEAELVVRGLDPSVPLLGFYSGVEIAPFGDYSRPLDWTGVLLALRDET